MFILTHKKFHQLLKAEYERGLGLGYKYGYQMGQIEARNRAIILGKTPKGVEFVPQSEFQVKMNRLAQEIIRQDKVNREVDQILKEKGF